MATQEQPIPSQKRPAVSPEALRQKLLRPYPSITLRGVLIFLVIILILAWSWQGSQPTEINRTDNLLGHVIDLIGLMFPPQFELSSATKVTYQIFGTSVQLGWPIIITAILETIQMSVLGTLGAVIMSVPLSLLAARNVSPHPVIYRTMRLILNLLRSIPELVFALIFVAAVGLGPFTGMLALAFGSVGSLSRVYAESIEQIDPQQVMALRAAGAGTVQTFIFAVIPQALPLLISYSIVTFEHNVRAATILGIVGAGGVGYLLFEYLGYGAYSKVGGTIIVMVITVSIIDYFSNSLRRRFI